MKQEVVIIEALAALEAGQKPKTIPAVSNDYKSHKHKTPRPEPKGAQPSTPKYGSFRK